MPVSNLYGVRLLRKPGMQRAALVALLVPVLLFRLAQFFTYAMQEQWGYDLSAYFAVAGRVLSGRDLYAGFQLAGPYSPQQQYLYLYPPPLAVGATPIAAVFSDYRVAAWLWALIGAAIAATVVVRVWHAERGEATRRDRLMLVGAAFAFPPLVGELVMGNVHLVLLGLFAIAWLSLRQTGEGRATRGELVAGAAIGLATLIKVFPGVVLLWFVLTGRWRALVAAVATMTAVALVTLPAVGLEAWLDYPRVLANLGQPVDIRDTLAPTVWLADVVGFTLARIVVTAAGIGAVLWSARTQPAAISFSVAVLASVLIAPSVYQHYLALAILPMLLALATTGLRPWLVVGYLAMFGGEQAALGDAVWIVNRLLPTLGALVILSGLLAVRRAPTRPAPVSAPSPA